MTNVSDEAIPYGLADLPLTVRRKREAETHCELQEGFTRRHLAEAAFERVYLEVQFDRLLRSGAALSAKLRGG